MSGAVTRLQRATAPHHDAPQGGGAIMAILDSIRLCRCGCGAPVRKHFVMGHQKRKANTPYEMRNVSVGRRVCLHRIRAERALGKPLPPKAIVHHADGSRDANAPLVICQDQAYHKLLHLRMKIRAAGGNPNTDKVCSRCKRVKPRTEFYSQPSGILGCSHRCRTCSREIAKGRDRTRDIERGRALRLARSRSTTPDTLTLATKCPGFDY